MIDIYNTGLRNEYTDFYSEETNDYKVGYMASDDENVIIKTSQTLDNSYWRDLGTLKDEYIEDKFKDTGNALISAIPPAVFDYWLSEIGKTPDYINTQSGLRHLYDDLKQLDYLRPFDFEQEEFSN